MDTDRIPAVEHYRGVRIHAWQPPERIAKVVRPAIDAVYGITDATELFAYAADTSHPPEARLFAEARCEAVWQFAAEGRAIRPKVDMVKLRAIMAGVDSIQWLHPRRYTAMLDRSAHAALRERPLPNGFNSSKEIRDEYEHGV